MLEWIKKDDSLEYDVVREYLLNPLQELCRKEKNDRNAFVLLEFSNDSIYALDNIYALKIFIKSSVDFTLEKLKSTDANLSSLEASVWPK